MRLAFVSMIVLQLLPGLHSDAVVLSRPDRVRIPAGEVHMGTSEHDLDVFIPLCVANTLNDLECSPDLLQHEMPVHVAYVSAFAIDRTEVTQAAYRRCAEARVCAPTSSSETDPRVSGDNFPVVGVNFAEAQRYCAFVGGHLPTEAQWERAARGDTTRTFPWGSMFNPHLCNFRYGAGDEPAEPDGHSHLAAVGSYPEGASPFGVLDMAGNAYEWTADYFGEDYYTTAERTNPTGPTTGSARVLRGGSFRSPAFNLLVSRRAFVSEDTRDVELGFRCAYD